ncbi:MAG: hypothetical protein IFK92_16325 [Acidobacteria bacterium]|nr:hypothetical protein [Candidatus Sulfomarinibacter kjeldsenii]
MQSQSQLQFVFFSGSSSRFVSVLLAVIVGVAALPSAATESGNPDTPEPGSIEAIAAATTEERFSSSWVNYVPESATVPDYLGHIVGAPGELSDTKQIYGYLRALAEASPRVRVETIGTTEEGRDIIAAIVADEPGMDQIDRLREATALLADPRRCNEACLENTLSYARPIYYLNGAIHSTETGSPEMLMELAYRLAVSERPEIAEIREKLVVLINPVLEPDGRDRMAEWFYRYLKGKTDYDRLPESSPPYWGRYVFHDNNRDTHQRMLALTQAVEDLFLRWHPQVMHDLHESIPLLQIWTGTGPYNIQMDPILVGEIHQMAFQEVRALSSLGMPGVWTWAFGEGWAHVYLDSIATNHNAIGRGYETFGIVSSEIMDVRLDLRSEQYVGKPVTTREWYRPWPPPRKFRWSLRNNINYQQTGVLSILQFTSQHAEDVLRDFWRKGNRSIKLGESEPPYAVAIPEKQTDRDRLAALVNLLRAHGIEVSRATEAFEAGDKALPAGTFVVRMDQPYRGYAVDLLLPQKYPIDEAEHRPYDDVTFSLSSSFGVDVVEVKEPSVREIATELVTSDVSYTGTVSGRGPVFILRDTGQEKLLAARHRLAAFEIEVAETSFTHDGADYPAGSWILPQQDGLGAAVEEVAAELPLDFSSASSTPDVPRHALDLPRLAVMDTWSDTENAEFPSHGSPRSSPDITGGFGYRGVANLREFVERGGVLVTLGGASTVPLDGGFVRNVRRARVKNLSTPGSEIRTKFVRPDHPLAYGYPEVTSVHRERLPLYETREAYLDWVVMQWGTKAPKFDDARAHNDGPWGAGSEGENTDDQMENKADEKDTSLVVSGGIKGASELEGKPAILDIPVGEGRVVAFNFDPIHRTLSRSDFRMVWNAILNWNDFPALPSTIEEGAP